ncbi:hypothetical protein, partial [Flavihumibacter sp. CACIAM 22H1]|uniref:NACHT domain-containing protein n=1 Tax=Flavihumibacter sp. CACIAM 22H1 TaxID=1812911 RepID=UPI0025B98418
ENDLSISVIHHPFNWQQPTVSKALSNAISSTSEIVISGHEHVGRTAIVTDIDENYQSIFIYSDPLQDSTSENFSCFNLITFDSVLKNIRIEKFSYDSSNAEYKLETPIASREIVSLKKRKSKDYQIKHKFECLLENPGATLTHSGVDEVKLSDIYTPPFFNNVSLEKVKKTSFLNFVHADTALDIIDSELPFYNLVIGTEGCGKTSLLKYFYLKFFKKNYVPIYIDSRNIDGYSIEKVKELVEQRFSEQYDELDKKYVEVDYSRVVIMIDDFHKLDYTKGKIRLIESIKNLFQHILITGNEVMLFEKYFTSEGLSIELFENFSTYVIQEYSPSLRTQLINKWCRLGKEYLDENEKREYFKKIDSISSNISTVIGKNLIPSYPIFIISIIQALESGETESSDNKLHAYYYEYLITSSLKKALSDKGDIGFYMTFAKEYFYFLFSSKVRFSPIDYSDFLKFVESHRRKYAVTKVSNETIRKALADGKILRFDSDNQVHVTYKYLYYYFTAKYLSDNLDEESSKQTIDLMADRVYRDEYSNILIFLTHLTRNRYVTYKLVEKSREIFREFEPVKLEKDIDFINRLQKELPGSILKSIEVEHARAKTNEIEDENEIIEIENENRSLLEDYDLNEDISGLSEIG